LRIFRGRRTGVIREPRAGASGRDLVDQRRIIVAIPALLTRLAGDAS
jgi:hypothetical protein